MKKISIFFIALCMLLPFAIKSSDHQQENNGLHRRCTISKSSQEKIKKVAVQGGKFLLRRAVIEQDTVPGWQMCLEDCCFITTIATCCVANVYIKKHYN